MTVEEIAIRQEVRQMLNEAGINRNTLKDMVKEVLAERIDNACAQAVNETDVDGIIARKINNHFDNIVYNATKDSIRERVNGIFNKMIISVDITDKNGTSSIMR